MDPYFQLQKNHQSVFLKQMLQSKNLKPMEKRLMAILEYQLMLSR